MVLCWYSHWQLADICAIIAAPNIKPEPFFFIYVITWNVGMLSVQQVGVHIFTHHLFSSQDRDGQGEGEYGLGRHE
jgi:hypothetical protein